MEYKNIVKGTFISRPNRFIAKVNIDGEVHTVHVKNTGRCKELLTDNATVFLEKSDNPQRKTLYDLVAVYKGDLLINMDSQSPNKAVYSWLADGGYLKSPTLIKPEAKYGSSRIDFYLENQREKAFVEVKGVTLESDGVARFPDAPTERGRKHLLELSNAVKEGYRAAVVFVIQMEGCRVFEPNALTDPKFAQALKQVKSMGVEVLAVDCTVTPSSMTVNDFVPVSL